MYKKKKERFKGMHFLMVFLLVLLMIFIIRLFNEEDFKELEFKAGDWRFYENFNPNIHICIKTCEDWYDEGRNFIDPPKELLRKCDLNNDNRFQDEEKIICVKQRKKTLQELETDYCNSKEGLKDSERCKCEEYKYKTIYNWSCELDYVCENGKKWTEPYDIFVNNWDNDTYAPQQTAISIQTMERPFKLILDTTKEKGFFSENYTWCEGNVINCKIVNEIRVKEKDYFSDKEICTQARPIPKPIEINLEEEKCVEHSEEIQLSEELKEYFDLFNSTNCDVVADTLNTFPQHSITNFQIAQQVLLKDIYDQYCCTKKEELNECEKGNNEYIEEEIIGKQNLTSNEFKMIKVSETICREKTIYDISCKELRKSLLLSGTQNFKFKSGEVVWASTLQKSSREDIFNKEEIYDIIVEKGCEI